MEFLGFTTQKGESPSEKNTNSSANKQKCDKNVNESLENQKVKYTLCIITAIAFAIRLHNQGKSELLLLQLNKDFQYDLFSPLTSSRYFAVSELSGFI